jgi:hypothetical protein
MATDNDNPELVDRTSIRDHKERGVGGSKASKDAKSQLAHSRDAKKRLKAEKKRIKQLRRAQSTDASN